MELRRVVKNALITLQSSCTENHHPQRAGPSFSSPGSGGGDTADVWQLSCLFTDSLFTLLSALQVVSSHWEIIQLSFVKKKIKAPLRSNKTYTQITYAFIQSIKHKPVTMYTYVSTSRLTRPLDIHGVRVLFNPVCTTSCI